MPDGNKRELPMQSRLAPIGSFNKEARTIDVVFSKGARVMRMDWWTGERYLEELSLEKGAVDLTRLNAGAPVLDTHNQWGLSGVIGVVERADTDGREGTATLRFSKRDDVQPIVQDIEDKIIRNVSVGYITRKVEKYTDKETGLTVRRAVEWQPTEISFVPVGADPDAGSRGKEQQRTFPYEVVSDTTNPADSAITRKDVQMDDATRAAEEAAKKKQEDEQRAAAAAAAKKAVDDATAAERARTQEITTRCDKHKLPAEFRQALITEGVSIDVACQRILDKLADDQAKSQAGIRGGIGIETVTDETETRRAGAVEALLHRANPGTVKITDNAKQFRGMTLRELMRDCLEFKGVRTRGMSVNEMWERTYLSGSDLPNIVLDAANKSLRAAYDAAPRTHTMWMRQTIAPDFKNINRIALSGAPSLQLIAAGAEFKRGIITDAKETYSLGTYGRILGINRQTIINDDMDAFTRLPALAARSASDVECDTAYAIVTANAALSDTGTLFNATAVTTAGGHANYTSSGTAISVASLGVGRAAMRRQVGIEGRVINVNPKYLIVPATQETLAEQYTSADFVSAKSSDINVFRTGRPSALTVVAEPRLDANSTTAWYLAADYNQVDTIEYAYLEGQQGVYLETRMGFDIDGMELKVRLDFAAKAIDYRGLYKNAGN